MAAADGAFYFVNLQLVGRCRTRQGTEESVVEPGQFVVVDTTAPYYFDFDRCSRSGFRMTICAPGWPGEGRGQGRASTARGPEARSPR